MSTCLLNNLRSHSSKLAKIRARLCVTGAALALTAAMVLSQPAAAAQEEAVSPQIQSAVDRGVAWLAQHQDPRTGGWGSSSGSSSAVASLCVMSFMARGHVPDQGRYGENVTRGIDFVLDQRKNVSGNDERYNMYEIAIDTMMLCEAYGMVDESRQDKIQKVVAKLVRVIITAQRIPKGAQSQGGWRYQPTSSDSDLSVSGWQLMALRGAANIGAAVPAKTIEDGIAYVKRQAAASGGFAYTGLSGGSAAMTGTGILSLELLGQHHTKEAIEGGVFLSGGGGGSGRGAMGGEVDYYGAYYCAQAANQLGGKYWDAIFKPIATSLLQRQGKEGAWQNGDSYSTAMALLALSVQYRYLPLYQR